MRFRVKLQRIGVIGLTLSLVTACATSPKLAEEILVAETISIQTTEIPTVSRVIALANGSAEIISALGLKKILIGRDIASTDEDLKSVEIVTSGHQVVAEKILALKPDLLLIDSSTGPASALDLLAKSGVTIKLISQSWNLADVDAKITQVASAIGVSVSGAQLIQAMDQRVKSSVQLTNKPRIAFLYLRGGSAIYFIGGTGSGADALIESIGGVDVGAATLKNPFNPLTAESIIALQPDLLLVMSKGLASVGGVEGLVALPGIAQTPAGKNSAVVAVDDSLMLSFGPRTPDLISKLSLSISKVLSR
jgi:iron complex transport system substrate-binding protein